MSGPENSPGCDPMEVRTSNEIERMTSEGYLFEACLQPGESTLSYDPTLDTVATLTVPQGYAESQAAYDSLSETIKEQISSDAVEYDVKYIVNAGVPSPDELQQTPEEQRWTKQHQPAYKPGAVTFFARAI